MNHCPVYQNIGGHSYGWVYPGPIGSILTPAYIGIENALDLPQASTLCNQCGVVCPVKIPLPDLLRKLREQQFERRPAPVARARGLARLVVARVAAGALRDVRRASACACLQWMGGSERLIHRLPLGRGWTDGRDMPAPAGRTFRELYAERRERWRPHDERAARPAKHRAKISRRGENLGTENAFVVLAEVNGLIRQGRDIVSFCIGQPDFPTPPTSRMRAIAAIRDGKHGYTPSAGIDELRAAAARDMGAAARARHRARRCRRRRRRQAVHRLHDRLGDRLRRRATK